MNTETKHTPGPWNDGIYHATRSGGRTFAHIRADGIVPIAAVPLDADGYGRAEGEANARLIAAAPEMAEALRALDVHWTEDFPSGPDSQEAADKFTDETLHVWRSARAALSKAGG